MAPVIIRAGIRLAPDTINRLERAAGARHDDAVELFAQKRYQGAVYLFGYCVEMVLAAASYRSAGFAPNAPIGSEERQRLMARARQLKTTTGMPMMNSDPHPLAGWARFLLWQRLPSKLVAIVKGRLDQAIRHAESVYKFWKPELRYKTIDFQRAQADQMHRAAS